MKAFIGTKIIDAELVDKQTFNAVHGRDLIRDEDNEPGYKVVYPDGYTSWRPKDVFEAAYRVLPAKDEAIENRFMYHPPKDGQQEKYVALRDKAKELAYMMLELCPTSRELSVALTELETSNMWANASIARNE